MYLHLATALFRVNKEGLMSNQLYHDTQAIVKNVFFCIAKQKMLDDTANFYLFQTGTDHLERLIGCTRMFGGHDTGMNYRQAIKRYGHALDV